MSNVNRQTQMAAVTLLVTCDKGKKLGIAKNDQM